jgi:hypothetical protein
VAENVTELRPYMSTVQMIREFADRVERGEVGSDHIVAIALDGKDGAVEVFGWGPRAGNPLEAVGMTTAAQHIILGGG